MIRHLLLLLALLALLAAISGIVVRPPVACAEEEAPELGAAGEGLLARLGVPVREAVAARLVRQALETGRPDPQHLAEALGHAGGAGSVGAIVRLLERGEPATRRQALVAAGAVGLRSVHLQRLVRDLATEGRGPEGCAALEALGAVGDGRDVPVLLEVAAGPDPATRRAAYAGLRRLLRVPIPPVHARWAAHWRVLEQRAEGVGDLLARLEAAEEEATRAALLDELAPLALLALEAVEGRVETWLVASEPAHRRLACRLVAMLRLADHAPALEGTWVHVPDASVREEARRALAVLGCRCVEANP